MNYIGKFIGHRGSDFHHENTLSSFIYAVNHGRECIEFDVQITTDNILYIFHDDELQEKSNGTGYFYEKSSEYISTLNCCGQKIPTLDETIKCMSEIASTNNKIVTLNIELKVAEKLIHDDNLKYEYDDYVYRLSKNFIQYMVENNYFKNNSLKCNSLKCNSLKRNDINILISSFDWHILENILNYIPPHVGIGFLSESDDLQQIENIKKLANNINISLNVDKNQVSKELIQKAHLFNIKLLVYTVNDLKYANELFEMGVDAIFTDRLF